MRALQIIALFVLAGAITFAGYRYSGHRLPWQEAEQRYIINDIYSLVVIPDGNGGCEAAVGYREKHVIGTFAAKPIKELVCLGYYFRDRPDDVFPNAPVVLVELENGEYHWILKSQLIVEIY